MIKPENFISADSLGEGWLQGLELIISQGEWVTDDSERLLELCPCITRFDSVDRDDPILLDFADQDRITLMQQKYSFCGVLAEYKISYGKLLYDNSGVNQIEWIIERLRSKRESKSATISLHKPGEEILSCLSMLDFKIRNETLQVLAVYRSQNAFASQPGNLIAIRDIQKKIAAGLSCGVGPINLIASSLHVYERDLSMVRAILAKAQEQQLTT